LVLTLTLLQCDDCKNELPTVKCNGTANREMNAVAAGREEGWRRASLGGERVADYCPECFGYRVLAGRFPFE
jgi:hypothetical protein